MWFSVLRWMRHVCIGDKLLGLCANKQTVGWPNAHIAPSMSLASFTPARPTQ
jgi:hypothetical protein